MTPAELNQVVDAARCRVIGAGDAGNAGHRRAMAALARAFDRSESALLCEPSLARKTTRPPDIVLIDPEVGVPVFEVKGVALEQVEAVEAGGELRIRYATGVRARSPIVQVRNAMFDVKDATARACAGDLRLPFRYWVVFPCFPRNAWTARFGPEAFCPPEFLFADELDDPAALGRRLGAADRSNPARAVELCPLDQLQCVWRAFGDTSVLYATPEDRQPRRPGEGTLGEQFDDAAEAHKVLSDEQQRLSSMDWANGPRLVRGVAGSGKTVVLANNLARRLERMLIARQEGLFARADSPRPRLLAVCFNRTLAPYVEKKIGIAFRQRTGRPVPEGMVDVCSFNTLMWRLTEAGLWRYQNVRDAAEMVRAVQYLGELQDVRVRDPRRLAAVAYDAIYVDEGQDFLDEEFRLLTELCRVPDGGEPNLYVFYDDAQNLYGRGRPNWQSVGLNVRGGRAYVMTQCFRNTRPIVEATFNVLFGTCAAARDGVPTREFGDLATLQEKGLIARDAGDGFLRVKFAPRHGAEPRISLAPDRRAEADLIVKRLRWLIEEQEVRPQDVMVLSFTRDRATQLAELIAAARIRGVVGVHVPFHDKDRAMGERGRLAVSTVASAKGYDAYCVLLASANEFSTDVTGRAHFYVGCTRAVEHLDVFAYEEKGLAAEMRAALSNLHQDD